MNQVEPGRVQHRLATDGKIPQEPDVVFCQNLLCKAKRLLCEPLKWRRTLWVNGEPGCMIVVATNGNCSIMLHPLDDFMGSWTIVHQIAHAPKLVEISLRKCFQRRQIGVNVGNDDNLHKASSVWRTRSPNGRTGGALPEHPNHTMAWLPSLRRSYHNDMKGTSHSRWMLWWGGFLGGWSWWRP